MIENLSGTDFAKLLNGIWKQRGWRTQVNPRDDGSFLVLGKREDGTLGLMYVLPGAGRTVEKSTLTGFRGMAKQRGASVALVATQGSIPEELAAAARGSGLKLMDGDDVRATVREGGFEELLSKVVGREVHLGETGTGPGGETSSTADGGNAAEGDEGALPGPLAPLAGRLPEGVVAGIVAATDALGGVLPSRESVPDPLSPTGDDDGGDEGNDGLPVSLPGRRVAAVVAVALVVVALSSVVGLGGLLPGAAAGGPPGDGTAVSVLSTAGPGNATLEVTWNARTADTVTNGNGTSYAAPEGEQFVVVQFNVTNTGDSPATLGQERLALAADGTRYGHQPLEGTEPFRGGLFAPNSSVTVWTVFSVPEGTTAGTVLVLPGEDRVGVTFVHDPELAVEAAG